MLSVEDQTSLQAEVRHLRALLADATSAIPLSWKLTATEEAVLRAMLAHDLATIAILSEVSGASAQAARVHVHRIRTKLKPHRVEIETVHGKGWRLIGREQWRAILAPRTEGVH